MKILGLMLVALVAFGLGRLYEKSGVTDPDVQPFPAVTAAGSASGDQRSLPVLESPTETVPEEILPSAPPLGVSAPLVPDATTLDVNQILDEAESAQPRNTAQDLSETLRLLGAK